MRGVLLLDCMANILHLSPSLGQGTKPREGLCRPGPKLNNPRGHAPFRLFPAEQSASAQEITSAAPCLQPSFRTRPCFAWNSAGTPACAVCAHAMPGLDRT